MAISNIKLASEQGVDYGQLQDLLSQQQWKAANQETTKVLIRATRQPSDALLDGTMIPRLPCTDLNTIDQLWRVASDLILVSRFNTKSGETWVKKRIGMPIARWENSWDGVLTIVG